MFEQNPSFAIDRVVRWVREDDEQLKNFWEKFGEKIAFRPLKVLSPYPWVIVEVFNPEDSSVVGVFRVDVEGKVQKI